MRLTSPEWLLLLLLWCAAAWYWPNLQIKKVLRWLCVILISLWLSGPEIRKFQSGMDLWVLIDRSESAEGILSPKLLEWEALIKNSKQAQDRLHWIDFASESIDRSEERLSGASAARFEGNRSETRIRSALLHALGKMDPKRMSKLLLLSDGFSTESLDGLLDKLRAQDVSLDLRFAMVSMLGETRITHLNIPKKIQIGTPFIIDVMVNGDIDGKFPVILYRNGSEVIRREVQLTQGFGRIRMVDLVKTAGSYEYEIRIQPPHDKIIGNNVAKQWVEVKGGDRILLISNYEDDPLVTVFQELGFQIEHVTEPSLLNLGSLSGTKAVLINNIPASLLPQVFIQGLNFYVHHQGRGLMMVGGKYSFGSGGYFASPIEDLLPVSMELKEDIKKLTVAMALVLDRSGSMSMAVPGTSFTKMDLANQGAANAIELLGMRDFVSVHAVDSAAHRVVPMGQVGKNRTEILRSVRSIRSEGGGIFVYEGLKAAWEELKNFPVGQRHVILFADADDSEEPGDYVNLLKEMVSMQGSVSVIGLGNAKSQDVELLKDIADRGKGRFFLNENPNALPNLFAQETMAVARSTFIEEPTFLHSSPGWLELGMGEMRWLPRVDGYNLCYLKPEARVAALSGDEYQAPLVSFWHRGAGRVAAINFPLAGDYSNLVRAWDEYASFTQTMARWIVGDSLPPGLGIRTQLDGNRMFADLYYDGSWTEKVQKKAPELVLALQSENLNEELVSVPWERQAPGHLRAQWEIPSGALVRGAVQVEGSSFSFGPINAILHPEWSYAQSQIEPVRRLSIMSGGKELADLTDVWRRDERKAWVSVQNWIVPLLLISLVFEAWQTRTGWARRRLS